MAESLTPLRVFINYRRSDSGGYAGRIYDALKAHSDSWHVFMDIDTIDPGADFTEVIDESLESCDVVLAVLGRQWLQSTDAKGGRRLDHPDDFVRLELHAALDRNVRVIPVLVQGAEMPSSEELPSDLVRLARRQGFELSDGRWHYDMDRLVKVLDDYQRRAEQPPISVAEPHRIETPPKPAPAPVQAAKEPVAVIVEAPEPAGDLAEPGFVPGWTTSIAGTIAIVVANFVPLDVYGNTLLKHNYEPLKSSIWFGLQLLVVPVLAGFVLVRCGRHRLPGEVALGMLAGFGLLSLSRGVTFLAYVTWTSRAAWLLVGGGLLLCVGSWIGLRRRRAEIFGRSGAAVLRPVTGLDPKILGVVGSGLCLLALILDVERNYRLLELSGG